MDVQVAAEPVTVEKESGADGHVGFSTPLKVVACLALYTVTWRLFVQFNLLPQEAYHRPVILTSIVQDLLLGGAAYWQALVFFAVGGTVLFLRRDEIRWKSIDPDLRTRNLVVLLLAPMVIQFAFYDYNYYFDHTHLADRLAIVVCWLLVAFHPAFLFPLTCLVMMVFYQLFYPLPLGNANWPDKLLPIHIAFFLNAIVFLRAFVKFDRHIVLLSTLVLTGVFYAHSALSKLLLGPHMMSWLIDDEIAFLFVSAYKNGGWLSFLSEQQVVDIAAEMKRCGMVQKALTLLIEGGAVLIVLNRWATRLVLVGCVALHLAILASSSIFFWKWVLVDLILLVYAQRVWRSDPTGWPTVNNRLILTGVAIVFTFVKFGAEGPLFAWWDTRHSKYCTYEVETVDGSRFALDPHYFAPYDLTFVQSRYYYAVPRKVLPGTFGVLYDLDAVRALNSMQSVDQFPTILERYGTNLYDAQLADRYRDFLQTYLTNAMRRERKEWVPGWFPPPYHFQARVPADAYHHGPRIAKLYVYFEEYFFDDKEIHQLNREEILEIPIPAETP